VLKKLEISVQTCDGEIAQIIKLHLKKQHFLISPTVFNIQTIFYSRQFLSLKCQKDYVSKQKGLIFQ